MSKLEELIEKLCPNGVEFKPIWSLTAWDKKFNSVEKAKQKKVITYKYYLSTDFEKVEREYGNIKYIATGISDRDRYTTEELATDYLAEGEIVCIPWGGTPNVKYYKGKFVTGDNRIATSLDINILNNKFLYYWMQSNIKTIASYYRGSGIKHPNMKKILDMCIPVPPLEVQCEIVHILDDFTLLSAELKARQKQYEYYKRKLFEFDDKVEYKAISEISKISAGGDLPKNYKKGQLQPSSEYPYPIYSNGTGDSALYGHTDNYKIDEDAVTVSARGTIGYHAVRKAKFTPIVRLITLIADKNIVTTKYLNYVLSIVEIEGVKTGIPSLTVPMLKKYKVPVPTIEEQERIVSLLDRFDKLCNNISEGIPAEMKARQKQYEYYRDKLLTFKELKEEK